MSKEEFYIGKYRVVRTERGMGMVYDPDGFEMIHGEVSDGKVKLIDIFTRIAAEQSVPRRIKAAGMIWTYEEAFGQYKNSDFKELIKYLGGYYDHCESGLTYPAIFNYRVEIIGGDREWLN